MAGPGASRLSGLSLALAALAGLLWTVSPLPWDRDSGPASWGVFFLLFVLAESSQLHLEIRRQTFSVSLSEVPLVLGLFLVDPLAVLVTRLLAFGVVAIARKVAPVKAGFNLSVFALETWIAVTILSILSDGETSSSRAWAAVVLAVTVANLMSGSLTLLAIAWSQGRVGRLQAQSMLIHVIGLGTLSTLVGLIALIVVVADSWGLILLAVVGSALFVLFRAYAKSVEQHRTLGRVHDFAKTVEEATLEPNGTCLAVAAVREQLNADRASLWLSATDELPAQLAFADADAGDGIYDGPDEDDDPLRERVLLGTGGLLFQSRVADEQAQAALQRRDATEVIAVPLSSPSGAVGYMEVCDRLGERLTFTADDVQLMESLAIHVSAAVQNAQLLGKLRFDAMHDQLTGLPNRLALTEIVGELLTEAETEAAANPVVASIQVAVIVVDLGALAQVNDTLGHDAGDQLLRVMTDLLRSSAPERASVGRMGGDEFAVVLTVSDLGQAEAEAERLRAATSVPARVGGVSVEVTATLGLCVGPLHGTTAASLLQRADVALYAGHATGRRVTSFEPEMELRSMRRLHLGTQLREAMLTGQIYVVFQPLCHLTDSSIRSVETLVRWNHPKHGAVSPDEFIPLAEQIGMINLLTTHVLALALRKCRSWLDRDLPIAVAVNLSVRTLSNTEFPAEVARALAESGVPAGLLTFEITESSVMADPGTALPVLHALHSLGVRLAIDDFGTGHSSLAYLSKLPVDEVKIDKTFIGNIGTEINDASITRAIIDLAHSLGLGVVAEGVEDELTRELLTRMNCDTIQGFLVSRPLPAARFDRWLKTRTAAHPSERDSTGYPVWLPSLH